VTETIRSLAQQEITYKKFEILYAQQTNKVTFSRQSINQSYFIVVWAPNSYCKDPNLREEQVKVKTG